MGLLDGLFSSDTLDNLQKLYIEELKDLYSAENQIIEALPHMIAVTSRTELKQAFEMHLNETRYQAQRLEQIFEMLGESPSGKTCKGMQGILKEGSEMMMQNADDAVRDAGLISAAQRVEHYEMAGYGTVRTYAKLLGRDQEEQLLQQTLDEEGDANKKLTNLAEGIVNREAVAV
jgi:ferritin-like metal-binding protein YciE